MEILIAGLDFARHVISLFDPFTCHCKYPDHPLVIGLTFRVGGGLA
jgi:hypothetical protein